MFNVFGETIDGKAPFADGERRSIHQPSVPLAQQVTSAGLFGGAGVGKTVLITEMIHNTVVITVA